MTSISCMSSRTSESAELTVIDSCVWLPSVDGVSYELQRAWHCQSHLDFQYITRESDESTSFSFSLDALLLFTWAEKNGSVWLFTESIHQSGITSRIWPFLESEIKIPETSHWARRLAQVITPQLKISRRCWPFLEALTVQKWIYRIHQRCNLDSWNEDWILTQWANVPKEFPVLVRSLLSYMCHFYGFAPHSKLRPQLRSLVTRSKPLLFQLAKIIRSKFSSSLCVLNRQDCGIYTSFLPPLGALWLLTVPVKVHFSSPIAGLWKVVKVNIASEPRIGSGERIVWSLSLSTNQG